MRRFNARVFHASFVVIGSAFAISSFIVSLYYGICAELGTCGTYHRPNVGQGIWLIVLPITGVWAALSMIVAAAIVAAVMWSVLLCCPVVDASSPVPCTDHTIAARVAAVTGSTLVVVVPQETESAAGLPIEQA